MRPHRTRKGLSRTLEAEVVEAMWAAYQSGKSLEQVGRMFDRTRQSIYGLFQSRGLKLRSKEFLPAVEYQGHKFTAQKTGGRHRYLRATDVRDGTLYLHHVIWIERHGPIPPGHKLAFKDGNHRNCAIENLELLTNSEQVRKYASKGQNQFTVTSRSRLELLVNNHQGGTRTLAAEVKR